MAATVSGWFDVLNSDGGQLFLLFVLTGACMIGTAMKVDGAHEWGQLCFVAFTTKMQHKG